MEMNPTTGNYPCPVCEAQPGEQCVNPRTGEAYATFHYSRQPQSGTTPKSKVAKADERSLEWLTNAIVRGNGF